MLVVAARLTQLFLLWFVLQAAPVACIAVNRTIDDEAGDIVTGLKPLYAPDEGWAQGSICTGCNLHPGIIDTSQPFEGTWHDSTHHPGQPDRVITVSFTGTAVYAFHLIANTFPYTTTFTNLTFQIDGVLVGNYIHIPDNTSDIQYRVPVYTNITLSNDLHVFETRASGPTDSLILFDFIIYTTEDDTSTSNSSATSNAQSSSTLDSSSSSPAQTGSQSTPLPIGAIVGGTVGGVCVLVVLITVLLCLRSRRARRPPSIAENIEPFTIERTSRQHIAPVLSGRRPPRAPMLPDLRLGRTRLMPGTGTASSTIGTESTMVDMPPSRRPRQPPPSTTGASTRSFAQTVLVQRIQALEAQMQHLEGEQTSSSSGTQTTRSNPSSRATSKSRGRSRSRTRTGRSGSESLLSELASLRNEIAVLRAELERDQRLLADAPPPVYPG